MSNPTVSPYEELGGPETLTRLVHAFYIRVRNHKELSAIFPGDWEETERKQLLFLTQFLGGPSLYSQERGHPMLRGRHMNFPITPKQAENWLSCMRGAMDDVKLEGPIRDYFYDRLVQVAHHMVNRSE